VEWADVIRDLDNLVEMEVAINGKGYVFRGQTTGVTGKVFQACGVALPPLMRPSSPAAPLIRPEGKACH
jgi:hypothetical protein